MYTLKGCHLYYINCISIKIIKRWFKTNLLLSCVNYIKFDKIFSIRQSLKKRRRRSRDFHNSPVVKTPLQGAWVHFLVQELRFHMPCCKVKKRANCCFLFLKGCSLNWTEQSPSLLHPRIPAVLDSWPEGKFVPWALYSLEFFSCHSRSPSPPLAQALQLHRTPQLPVLTGSRLLRGALSLPPILFPLVLAVSS